MERIESLEEEARLINGPSKFPSNPKDGEMFGPFEYSVARGTWKAKVFK